MTSFLVSLKIKKVFDISYNLLRRGFLMPIEMKLFLACRTKTVKHKQVRNDIGRGKINEVISRTF